MLYLIVFKTTTLVCGIKAKEVSTHSQLFAEIISIFFYQIYYIVNYLQISHFLRFDITASSSRWVYSCQQAQVSVIVHCTQAIVLIFPIALIIQHYFLTVDSKSSVLVANALFFLSVHSHYMVPIDGILSNRNYVPLFSDSVRFTLLYLHVAFPPLLR